MEALRTYKPQSEGRRFQRLQKAEAKQQGRTAGAGSSLPWQVPSRTKVFSDMENILFSSEEQKIQLQRAPTCALYLFMLYEKFYESMNRDR